MNTKRVIMLAGQSNAVGHSLVKYLPDAAGKISPARVEEMKKGYPPIRIIYSNNYFRPDRSGNEEFVPVTFGFGKKAAEMTFGPEVGIAEYLNGSRPGEEFYIVKCATGGTTLFENWNPDRAGEAGNLYAQMLSFTGEALGKLTADGSKVEIIAFCWMQGETDSYAGVDFYRASAWEEYGVLFGKLVDGFSERFGPYLPEGGLPVIQGGVSSYWENGAPLNAVKQSFAKSRRKTYYFDNYDLTYNVDNNDVLHFDAAATVLLGNRFGEYITKNLS